MISDEERIRESNKRHHERMKEKEQMWLNSERFDEAELN